MITNESNEKNQISNVLYATFERQFLLEKVNTDQTKPHKRKKKTFSTRSVFNFFFKNSVIKLKII